MDLFLLTFSPPSLIVDPFFTEFEIEDRNDRHYQKENYTLCRCWSYFLEGEGVEIQSVYQCGRVVSRSTFCGDIDDSKGGKHKTYKVHNNKIESDR